MEFLRLFCAIGKPTWISPFPALSNTSISTDRRLHAIHPWYIVYYILQFNSRCRPPVRLAPKLSQTEISSSARDNCVTDLRWIITIAFVQGWCYAVIMYGRTHAGDVCSDKRTVQGRTNQKRRYGFQNGDIIRSAVTEGKYKGTYVGRVMMRSSRSFAIRTTDGHLV